MLCELTNHSTSLNMPGHLFDLNAKQVTRRVRAEFIWKFSYTAVTYCLHVLELLAP